MPRISLFICRIILPSWCVLAAGTNLYGQSQIIAHVLDVKGEWHLDGSATPLNAGAGLSDGAKVVASPSRPGNAITIVRDEDLSRQRVVCDASPANPCNTAILVKGPATAGATAPSQLKTVVQATFALLLGNPPSIASHYALTLTRGVPAEKELEDVVQLDPAGTIALPAAPADMPPGTYTILIAPAGTKSPTEQTAVLSSERAWSPLPFPATGLYEVSVRDAEGHRLANMMLLVVQPGQLDKAQKSFEEMRSRTSRWSGPSARMDEHLFLRSFLLTESHAL